MNSYSIDEMPHAAHAAKAVRHVCVQLHLKSLARWRATLLALLLLSAYVCHSLVRNDQGWGPGPKVQAGPSASAQPVATTSSTRRDAVRTLRAQHRSRWRFCAYEGGRCTCPSRIRWGNDKQWLEVAPKAPNAGVVLRTVECSAQEFRDILPGEWKRCECLSLEIADVAEPSTSWIFCAGQWQECSCEGRVRWGNKDTWFYIEPKAGMNETIVHCSVKALPDNLPGDDGKHCECLVQHGTAYYARVNPAFHPAADISPSLIGSCDKYRHGAAEGQCGSTMWAAVEAFCSPDWASRTGSLAGDKSLDEVTLKSLMRLWVDPRFRGNYERLYNRSGWIPRAFVNYFAGRLGGKHARMTEELIQSVHLFSSEPIVVVNFGFVAEPSWQPDRFPRLVLLFAEPLPLYAARSFNFNKFRAMILSRVLVGVQLDSDQFVAPGVDAIFPRIEQEVTASYPFPILPAHFLDWGPTQNGPGGKGHKLWDRYCPEGKEGKCRWQTARWGHAHPTWTFWALPFLGRWLRRNFRDEWLPPKDSGKKALRVLDVEEDEDLLNVATWEEGGTKQWCKFDVPNPSQFLTIFDARKMKDGEFHCQGRCPTIDRDPQYNPNGVAIVFYTVHNAIDLNMTRMAINRLLARDVRAYPPPIMYEQRFYKNGKDFHAANPRVRCLI